MEIINIHYTIHFMIIILNMIWALIAGDTNTGGRSRVTFGYAIMG